MSEKLIYHLQNQYKKIQRIEEVDHSLIIYADDDTLWEIMEELRDQYNMEFEAGAQEENFIRILI